MKKITKAILAQMVAGGVLAMSLGSAAYASGSEAKTLTINGETIPVTAKAPEGSPLPELFSGWVFRSAETQAMQMDDFDNPGMIFVDQAWETWSTPEGSAGKSCADCHGDPESFAGLRAVTPKWNEAAGEVYTLEDYINESRVKYMGADKWKYSGGKMAAMVALISLQSRGDVINVKTDGPAAATWEKGKEIYYTRVGQLDMSCANCHEDNYGVMIRADHLSQGQLSGFPAYRLKNAKLNTAQGRFKGCMKNIRATPYKVGGEEFRALQLYVASRGNGLVIEGPSVRN
jgi:L-cysteine S-thiosulfotransferase